MAVAGFTVGALAVNCSYSDAITAHRRLQADEACGARGRPLSGTILGTNTRELGDAKSLTKRHNRTLKNSAAPFSMS